MALVVADSGLSSRSWEISRMPGVLAGRVVACSGDVGPVDGCCAGPEVLVFLTVIVVEVELGDAGLEEFEGGVDAYRFFPVAVRWAWPMSRQTPTRSKWPTRRISRRCSGVVISF